MSFTKIFLLFLLSCTVSAQLPDTKWHAAIILNDTLELPFTFTTEKGKIIIHNGEENIEIDDIKFLGDSVIIQMPVFDSEFRVKLNDSNLKGVFNNHARKKQNVFEFHAESGLSHRFSDKPERTNVNINGRYTVRFDEEEEWARNAVAIFKQDGNRLTGTFLTITGDYRYLEGELNGNRLWLSAFDGSHSFLFTAIVKGDSIINGHYFSGKHWHDTWTGKKDANAKLPEADNLTEFTDTSGKFYFEYPDENGRIISINDERFINKPVIVQLMGSWCSNCMDETRFLSQWYNTRKSNTIEIIALDYERISDSTTANKNIRRLKKQFDVRYPMLFAGSSDNKKLIAGNLKLTKMLAFPTTIFLNKDKRVVKIHTGFNGPATGEEFDKFKMWFDKMIIILEK